MATEFNFKVGEVVKLKSSNSPTMTIEKFTWDAEKKVNFTDKVDCIWISDNKLYRESFHTITLKPE